MFRVFEICDSADMRNDMECNTHTTQGKLYCTVLLSIQFVPICLLRRPVSRAVQYYVTVLFDGDT